MEKLFDLAERLEERLKRAQAAAMNLAPSLLAKAFRGELVPQDPFDEPAQQMLERLKAEKAPASNKASPARYGWLFKSKNLA